MDKAYRDLMCSFGARHHRLRHPQWGAAEEDCGIELGEKKRGALFFISTVTRSHASLTAVKGRHRACSIPCSPGSWWR